MKSNLKLTKTHCGGDRRSSHQNNWLMQALVMLWLLIASHGTFAATGQLSALVVPNLSPAFDANVKQYTIPKSSSCSTSVKATLASPTAVSKLYVANNLTTSGSTVSAWYCNSQGKIEIVLYEVWTEVGRYTITPVDGAPPPPPPPAVNGKLSGLVVANLSPAFDPNVTQYTVTMPANCSVSVNASVPDPTNPNLKLYISSTIATSGKTVNTWVCGSQPKVEIIIYDVWTEVGHYTITPTGTPTPTPPPNPPPPPPTPVVTDPPTEQIPAGTPPPLALPNPAPVDKNTAVHFLEQATFGPTPVDVAAVQSVGLPYWMAQQYNLPASTIADGLSTSQVTSQLFLNMANGPDQLRQRMMFALGQIFVVSANKNINGEELVPWVRLLSRNAFGNFRQLLKEVTFIPTMGKYLDLANSMKATSSTSPNENYAREVMQLFTIGLKQLNQDGSVKLDAQGQAIPTYDQTTLREVARALTGLTYPTAPGATPQSNNWEYFVGLMEYRLANHDTGTKTLLNGTVLPTGQTVKQDFDAVIDMLVQHPNTAPFIATRLIRSLVTSNPSPAYIQRVADVFVDNGHGVRGDLWPVLTAVLTDTEALAAPSAQNGHLKDPVLHVLGLGRALGAQITDPNMFMYSLRNLGEQVLAPNTVFSFYSPLANLPGNPGLFGPEFQIYSPGLVIQRANLIYQILNGELGTSYTVNLAPFTALAGDPAALVEKVNQALFFGRMSNGLRQTLLNLTTVTPDSYNRVMGVLYFAALSSEYAVQP